MSDIRIDWVTADAASAHALELALGFDGSAARA